MTIVNHECYVSLEVAKLLKKAGFDWKLNSRWQDWGGRNPHEFILKTDLLYADCPAEYDGFHALPAPTLDIAQRWLREVKGIEVYAHVFYDSRDMSDELIVYVYEVNHITEHIEDYISSYDIYDTYEEAQEAGIKKVLEIILEKEE